MHGLQPAAPVATVHLFPEERAALLSLLGALTAAEWARPTACPGWSVKDVALHLLADDLNTLSRLRDRFTAQAPGPGDDLVAFINRQNASWVEATRRLSPRVLCDLLEWTSGQTVAYFAALAPNALGGPVEWAGPAPAPNWLEIAREYTERWVHQQQVREAVGAAALTPPHLFAPVLATFARALPQTYRAVAAPAGTTVALVVEGDAGGAWTIARTEGSVWALYEGVPAAPTALARLDQDAAWRLFTRALPPDQATQRVTLEGELALARRVLDMVAILA